MTSLSWDEVRAGRLARSHLVERAPAERLVEVVRDVCGIHAQVTSLGGAAAGGARRGDHAGRRPRRALGAARAGEDLDAARDASPAPGRGAASVDGSSARGRRRGRLRRRRARAGRRGRRGDRSGPARAPPDPRGAGGRRRGACRRRAPRRARIGLGLLPGRRGDRGPALLRPAAGAAGDVRPSRRLARPAAPVGARRGAARGRPPLRAGLRPRDRAPVPGVVHLEELHAGRRT